MPKSRSFQAALLPSAGESIPNVEFSWSAMCASRARVSLPHNISGGNAMKLARRQFLHLAAGAAALPTVSRIATAQTYPSRPITIVVPYPPGGLIDALARILAESMRGSLGQTIVIENIGGANGSIGVGRVARGSPDGYTLSIGT